MTDPLLKYAYTVRRLANHIESVRHIETMMEDGLAGGWVKRGLEGSDIDPKEWVETIKAFPQSSKDLVKDSWIKLEDVKAIKEGMHNASQSALDNVALRKMTSYIKSNVTSKSIHSHVRNFTSGAMQMLQSGNPRAFKYAWKARQVADAFARPGAAGSKEAQRLMNLGVLGGSLEGDLIQRLSRNAGDPFAGMARFDRAQLKAGEIVKRGIRETLLDAPTLTKFYVGEDNFFKALKFYEEEDALLRNYKGKVGPNIPGPKEIEKRAAMVSQLTYFNYARVSPAVAALRKIPMFASFPSFPYEVFRTTLANVAYGLEQVKNPAERFLGLRRLAATATAMAIPTGLVKAGMARSNVSQEELDAMKRNLGPWERSAAIVPIGRDKEGNIRYYNVSYTDPTTQWTDILRAAQHEHKRSGSLLRSLGKAMMQGADPFVSEDMVFAMFRQQLTNTDAFGRDIRGQNASPVTMTSETINHLAPALFPAYFKQGFGLAAGIRHDVNQSNMTRRNVKTELGVIPGVLKERVYNPRSNAPNRAYDLGYQLRDVPGGMNKALADTNKDFNAEEWYAVYQGEYGRVMEQYVRFVDDMRTAGLKNREIQDILGGKGLTTEAIKDVMKGQYRPKAFDRDYRSSALADLLKESNDPSIRMEIRETVPERTRALAELSRQARRTIIRPDLKR